MRITRSRESAAASTQRVPLRPRRLLAGATATSVIVLAVATFSGFGRAPAPDTILTAGTDFTITSAIRAYPSCSGPTVLFYPGVTRCITYTVSNHLGVPITVKTLQIAVNYTATPTPRPGCDPAANLDLSGAAFSAPPMSAFTVSASPASASSPGLPIKMTDSGNQNACQSTTSNFTY